MSDKQPIAQRVAIVYPHLPHYRYGVFSELDGRIDELLFVHGGASRDGSIATTPSGTFRRESLTSNLWIGPILWQRGLQRELRRFRPDVVIYLGDSAHLSTWVSASLSRLRGRRVYFWTIGWHRPEKGVRRVFRKTFYSIAHSLLLYGDHAMTLGRAAGYPDGKMRVIRNSYGSRTDAESAPLDGNLPSGRRPVIGAVIRLSHTKGLEKIILSASILRAKYGIDVECLIVGDGPARERLATLAESLGVALHMPGAAYRDRDHLLVYEILDVTVIPRAAGLTVLQSLRAGTPVVTIANANEQMPEFEAIEHGFNGYLVSEATPDAIAHACALVLRGGLTEPENRKPLIGYEWTEEGHAETIVDILASDLEMRRSPSARGAR